MRCHHDSLSVLSHDLWVVSAAVVFRGGACALNAAGCPIAGRCAPKFAFHILPSVFSLDAAKREGPSHPEDRPCSPLHLATPDGADGMTWGTGRLSAPSPTILATMVFPAVL